MDLFDYRGGMFLCFRVVHIINDCIIVNRENLLSKK